MSFNEEHDQQSNEETQEEKQEDIEDLIESLDEAVPLFRCKGIARVKIGKRTRPIRIRSVDLDEAVLPLKGKRPRPPTERCLIKAGSAEGRAAGLTKNTWVTVVDENDPAYEKALGDFNEQIAYLIFLKGLDLEVRDINEKVVWDPDNPECQDGDEALRVLRKQGLTNWQFGFIADAVNDLTRFEEQKTEGN